LRGRELLEQADLVFTDALAGKNLRIHAQKAQWIDVGKRAGAHSMTQDAINELLIEHARAGRRVVRLKGGDPFIFGRGGEEAAALEAAGIEYEIVPGITAAAGLAFAGIPLTHRNINSSVTLVTGHEADESTSDIDWSALAKLPCVVFYMGVRSLPQIALKLIEAGLPPDTPAACVQWVSTPRQRTVESTIAEIADAVAAAELGAPAITIIGRGVPMRKDLRWFDNHPLFGKTIVVTRTRVQASVLSTRLIELGANVIEAPTIQVVAPPSWAEVDGVFHALARAPKSLIDWLIFTSPNAVTFTRERLNEIGLDARVFAGAKIAVVGDATARAVETVLSCRVDLCPREFYLEALADALRGAGEIAGRRFILLRADIARPALVEQLRAGAAASVQDIAIYQTQMVGALPEEVIEALTAKTVDWVTFTSSSTAKNLVSLLGDNAVALLNGVKTASIGPSTSQSSRDAGVTPTVEASPHSIDGLVEAILRYETAASR
jgi:uroporphyrinogen III methyltransferase/synthase